METASRPGPGPRRLRDVIVEDVKRGGIAQTFRRDVRDIYRFYLTEGERERLDRMKRVKRFVWITWWLVRNLLLRLSPTRRLMLVLAAVALAVRPRFVTPSLRLELDFAPLAFVLVLLVLALELKDKLLARDEIEVARQVQISLLPKSHPEIPGWEVWSATIPANDVGGDLIDYLDGASGRTGLALGDVAGKGMGAALLCAKLQATLRALAPQAGDLVALGAGLNGVLERAGLDNRYATLFYCEISAGDPVVRYLNAGHNPALLAKPSGIVPLPASSLPLGMLPGAAYAQGSVTLGAGDALVLYSDGITEATDARGSEYGLARLEAAVRRAPGLAAPALGRLVLDDVGRFLERERPHDDQSILVVRRTE